MQIMNHKKSNAKISNDCIRHVPRFFSVTQFRKILRNRSLLPRIDVFPEIKLRKHVFRHEFGAFSSYETPVLTYGHALKHTLKICMFLANFHELNSICRCFMKEALMFHQVAKPGVGWLFWFHIETGKSTWYFSSIIFTPCWWGNKLSMESMS